MKKLIFLLSLSILASCAGPYYYFKPQKLNFPLVQSGNIAYGVIDDVIKGTHNNKVRRKLKEYHWKMSGVKLVNTGSTAIPVDSLKFTVNGRIIYLYEADYIFKTIKQHPFAYLPYSIAPVIELRGKIYPFGILFTAGNFYVALKSNKKLKLDLTFYNLKKKIIAPGETIYGLATYHNYEPGLLKISE